MSGYGAKGREKILRRMIKDCRKKGMPEWVDLHCEKTMDKANFRVRTATRVETKRLAQTRHLDELLSLTEVLYSWRNRDHPTMRIRITTP